MTKQIEHGRRSRRALVILRELAKKYGYRVGGRGGTQVDEFMAAIESGEIVLVMAERVDLQPHKDYWSGSEGEIS